MWLFHFYINYYIITLSNRNLQQQDNSGTHVFFDVYTNSRDLWSSTAFVKANQLIKQSSPQLHSHLTNTVLIGCTQKQIQTEVIYKELSKPKKINSPAWENGSQFTTPLR